ncbi:MAG: hypothetical protein ACK4UY_03815 [Dietzia sp.]
MSYTDVARMAGDGHLRERIAACAATEGVTSPHPTKWADDHQWQLAGTPGWGDAYTYALLQNNEAPGRDESVISDGMILSAVQTLRADLGDTP